MVLGHSPYKICELDLSSLKASKNLEFLEITSVFSKSRNDGDLMRLLPRNDAGNSRIPKTKNTQKTQIKQENSRLN